ECRNCCTTCWTAPPARAPTRPPPGTGPSSARTVRCGPTVCAWPAGCAGRASGAATGCWWRCPPTRRCRRCCTRSPVPARSSSFSGRRPPRSPSPTCWTTPNRSWSSPTTGCSPACATPVASRREGPPRCGRAAFRRGRRRRAGRAGPAGRRPGLPDLHLRQHRHAQGRGLHARPGHVRGPGDPVGAALPARRRGARPAAAVVRLRPLPDLPQHRRRRPAAPGRQRGDRWPPAGEPGRVRRHGAALRAVAGDQPAAAARPRGRAAPAAAPAHKHRRRHAPGGAGGLRRLLPGLSVQLMFGLTECKRAAIMPPDADLRRPGACGRALPGTEIFTVDAEGRRQPPGVPGELVVRGPHVMAGYWRRPELTAQRFRRVHGLFPQLHTGDHGHVDDDGYVHFAGRRDDVYKEKGTRVSATEVEAAAYRVDGVAAAGVLPPADGRDGATLFVVAALTPADVLRRLREQLEEMKVPARCVVLPDLPLTGNGKVDRRALARLAGEHDG
ncbi:LOW QUALITY PROTEIN: AMP-dependent synthetase and ligase, partial [Micromonospora sp. M42]